MRNYSLSTDLADKIPNQRTPSSPAGLYAMGLKRIFDVVIALAILPIIVPVILILWIMTRRDGGPGFYSQDRVGLNGKVFKCVKMRSMVVNAEDVLKKLCESDSKIAAEWNGNQKLSCDPRITRVGRFIRATSLDELPQIWNVLKGEMSFVGPRPFMVEQESMYRNAGGDDYFKMRPGITGLWQIEGRGTTSFVSRIDYDASYFKRLSFGTDIVLMIKTGAVVFNRTGH